MAGMGMFSHLEKVGNVRERIMEMPEFIDGIPERRTALWSFRTHVGRALRLLVEEPEIVAFAAAQWIVVVFVYALWAWGARQIDAPEEFEWVGDLAFAAWSLACIALVAWPVAFLSACIGMVHFLRQEGEESTAAACMRRVAPRMRPLWTFTFIDVGFTALQWLERMPGRRSRSEAQIAVSEGLYYAWKVATVGILPAILADRTLMQAAGESVELVKKRLAEALLLRSGYTLTCWLVGTAAFALSLWQVRAHRASLPDVVGGSFWFWAPVVIALGIVHLFIRPVFLLASADLYHQYRRDTGA